ncbi:hypothetical protein GGI43DRAFT_397347 [Trichoderma evansii]
MADLAITTPHILHHIFLFLPQQDLLLVQRVCRTWYKVISSSKILLAALFLCPEPANNAYSNGSFELNPLLQSRFPSFFGSDLLAEPLKRSEHGIGPWLHSHWTENMQPWPESQNHRPPSPILDPRRVAAYKYPKASWRRMIPCMPPAIELQINFECRKPASSERNRPIDVFYTLRSLKFSNEIESNGGASALQDSADEHLRQPWLTFGLLHDIVEAFWFKSIPTTSSEAQFDYSFQETRPYRDLRVMPGKEVIWPTPEERTAIGRYGKREKLRDIFPEKKIGGAGRILVHLTEYELKGIRKKQYRGKFRVDTGAVQRLKWDEEIDYKINPRSS